MVKKILIFDIDGTILDYEKQVPEGVQEAFEKARENGHEVVIATGRAPFTAKKIFEQLKIDSYICYNGQIVQFQGETVHKGILEKHSLERLTDYATNRNQPLVYMDMHEMVSSTPDHEHVIESISTLKIDFPRYGENFYAANDIHQALIFCDPQAQKEYEETFPELSFVRWHKHSCDVLPQGMSKAVGIEILLKYLGRGREDTIAFGDGLNDREMLAYAGVGVAMGNCVEELRDIADFVTDAVDEDGLVNAMKKLRLI